jgi:Leucine-rich repeat (LRR) protein
MADPFAKTTVVTSVVKITETVNAEEPLSVEKTTTVVPTKPVSNVAPDIAPVAPVKTISIAAANPVNIEAIKKLNVVVTPVQSGSNGLSLNFVNLKNFNNTMLDQAIGLKEQVVQLKLTNQPVTDQDLQKIKQFKNLRQLQLEKTKVTDEGMEQLKSMQSLEQLNLYGTTISDKGLEKLAACKNLKTLFLWKTNATAEGIAKLKQALPNLTIEAGGFAFKKPDTTKK